MSDDPVRFGLIGFGAWGQCHADAITKTQGAELVAIAARSDKTCQSAREIYPQAKIFSNYRQMLERDDIDIVDIVLPTFLHHEAASTALSAGKHLLLEKPMAPTIQQCNELLQLAREHDRLLAIGHELRLSSLWGKVKRLIDDDFIVKVTSTRGALWASWSGAMDRTRHPTFFLRTFDGEKVEELTFNKMTGELFELKDQIALLVNAIRHAGSLVATGENG